MNTKLFNSNISKSYLTGYKNISYLSNSHNGRSQIGYLFMVISEINYHRNIVKSYKNLIIT